VTLGQRILREKRSTIVGLALAIVANIAVYAFAVYPLSVKSANAAERAAAAEKERQTAERDAAAARELITGKDRADKELTTFYGKVLPADYSSARRLTYTPVVKIAARANIKFLARSEDEDLKEAKKTGLGRLHTKIQFQCDYESFRTFIYELESAPEFIIIDDVALAQPDPSKPLELRLEMSTYFRASSDGT
jgi:hypothetical protein